MRIGRLTYAGKRTRSDGYCTAVICRCDCGRMVTISSERVKTRQIPESCRTCVRFTHRQEYERWKWLRRSGSIHRSWTFPSFLKALGPAPEGARIAKRDRTKKHSPSNSYWRTQQ